MRIAPSGIISIRHSSFCAVPTPQAIRPPDEPFNVVQVTLAANFKVARFEGDVETTVLRQLQDDIEAVRFEAPEGPIELPVKLKLHQSVFVPLAKSAMLLAGNYRCVTKEGPRPINHSVHDDPEEAPSVYAFVLNLCMSLGAAASDLVPFDKYAAAARGLSKPSSAARALFAGRSEPCPTFLTVRDQPRREGCDDFAIESIGERLVSSRSNGVGQCIGHAGQSAEYGIILDRAGGCELAPVADVDARNVVPVADLHGGPLFDQVGVGQLTG